MRGTVVKKLLVLVTFVAMLLAVLTVQAAAPVESVASDADLMATPAVAMASPSMGWGVEASFPGDNVAVSGPWSVVTSWNFPSPGTATVYHNDGTEWAHYQELEPSALDMDDPAFGRNVAVDGRVAAVSATEAVYVFEFDGAEWVERAKLVASNIGDVLFGRDVYVDGSTITVGGADSAYVFVNSRRGWTEQVRLTASDGELGDYFGGAVAVSGDTVVVAASGRDNPGVGDGAVYVFDRSGSRWVETAILTPSEIHSSGFSFGGSVDVLGETVAVSGGFWRNGAAWVFERSRDGWVETELLRSVVDDGIFFFGEQIVIDGQQIAVSAPGGFLSSSNGEIFLFRQRGDSWLLEQRVETGNPLIEEGFGFRFDLSGEVLAGVADYPESVVYFLRR